MDGQGLGMNRTQKIQQTAISALECSNFAPESSNSLSLGSLAWVESLNSAVGV